MDLDNMKEMMGKFFKVWMPDSRILHFDADRWYLR